VANLLHVTPRTLHNWNSGRYDIPYAAFKLLRVLMRYELPHDDWAGWHFSGGKL
jgi:DNA-binding transcriptional regulator YiaG